nr:triacylglycerol lipase [Streptococcus suis]
MGKIKYVDEPNLQVAMSEYDTGITKDYELYDQYDNPIGTVTLDFDNENGNGEQVYAVVKDPNLPKDHVLEVTVLFRGSTGPNEVLSKPAD